MSISLYIQFQQIYLEKHVSTNNLSEQSEQLVKCWWSHEVKGNLNFPRNLVFLGSSRRSSWQWVVENKALLS